MRRVIAAKMRAWADSLDRYGAPKHPGLSFYFEEGVGIVIDQTGQRGCRLWYLGNDEYKKALLAQSGRKVSS